MEMALGMDHDTFVSDKDKYSYATFGAFCCPTVGASSCPYQWLCQLPMRWRLFIHIRDCQSVWSKSVALIELLLNYQEVIDCVRPSVMQSLFNNDWNSRPWPNEYSRDYQNLKTRYDGCAGPDWPTFPELVESKLDQVAQHIKDEIFNTKIWNWSNEVGKIKRHDPHPTPAEHLEYLDRELKEFNISQKTRELVNVIEQQVQNFEPLLDWQPQFKTAYPVRW